MHRALAVHVREQFLARGVVSSVRSSMVATAVDVSLKYPPVPGGRTRGPGPSTPTPALDSEPATAVNFDCIQVEPKKIKKKKKQSNIVDSYVVKAVSMA